MLITNNIVANNLLSNNGCGESWAGIEVWGNKNAPQTGITAGTAQGVVILKNGAIIENAQDAVRLWKPNDWNSMGGIIQATNATFRNNSRDVEFMSYQNMQGGVEKDNLSFFKNCRFETTNELGANVNLRPHVTLWDVKGVKFEGNVFEYAAGLAVIDQPARPLKARTGIHVSAAGVDIKPWCDPNLPIGSCDVPNRFINLSRGVVSENPGKAYHLKIRGTEFDGCMTGIALTGEGYATITNNDFKITPESFETSPGVYSFQNFGISTKYAAGYTVQENNFSHKHGVNSGAINIGILNENTGPSDVFGGASDIYRNTFTGLSRANSMQQDNTLIYRNDCNTYTNNTYAWAVTSGHIFDQGNCPLPGSTNPNDALLPQANQFLQAGTGIFISDMASPFTYSAYNVAGYVPTKQGANVTVTGCPGINTINYSEACPNSVTGTSGTISSITQLQDKLQTNKTTLAEGGSITLLKAIDTKNDGQLKNDLLAKSPYLSDEVLIKYSETPTTGSKAVAPGTFKQVIVANSPVTEPVKEVIDKRSLPPGIRQQIQQAQAGTSERLILETETRQIEQNIELLATQLTRSYLDSNQVDSAILFLEQQQTINSQLMLLSLQTDSTKLDNTIRALQDSVAKYPYIEPIVNYYEFITPITYREGSVFKLNDSELQAVRDFAADNSVVSAKAQCILTLVYGVEFERVAEPIESEQARLGNTQNEDKSNKVDPQLLTTDFKVYPNPAKDGFTIEYQFNEKIVSGLFLLYDMYGKIVISQLIKSQNGKEQIGISTLADGLYYYNLVVNNQTIAREKLIIIKH